MPAAVVLVNAKRVPSGLQRPPLSFAPGGVSTLISVPSGSFRIVRELLNVALCRPFVLGLIRWPASRSIGCDTSEIGG